MTSEFNFEVHHCRCGAAQATAPAPLHSQVKQRMGYTHLSQDERYQIQRLRSGGLYPEQIARQIQRIPSTVRGSG